MVVLHDYIMRRSLKRDSVLADADRVEHHRRYHVVKQQKTREQSREHGEEWGDMRQRSADIVRELIKEESNSTRKVPERYDRDTQEVPK